jgi:hypothetical protein
VNQRRGLARDRSVIAAIGPGDRRLDGALVMDAAPAAADQRDVVATTSFSLIR